MLKIFLLTRNEELMLEDWLLYHGYIFGFENIHVIDGSDKNTVFETYDKYLGRGLNVYHDTSDLNQLADVLTEQMHKHKGTNNFLIKVDTDEFLSVAKYPRNILSERICRRTKLYDYTCGYVDLNNRNMNKYFDRLPVSEKIYKAAFTTWSIPGVQTNKRPCREMTIFTPVQSTLIKSFYHSDSFRSVDLGGHGGFTSQSDGFLLTPLCVIHYHSISVDDSLRRARQALESHGYINPGDDDKECIRKLKDALKPGSGHVMSTHKARLYLSYLQKETDKKMLTAHMNSFHPYFKNTKRRRKITLVSDTLSTADQSHVEAGV